MAIEKASVFYPEGKPIDKKLISQNVSPIASITVDEDDMFMLHFEEYKEDPKDLDHKPWLVVKHTEFDNVHVL